MCRCRPHENEHGPRSTHRPRRSEAILNQYERTGLLSPSSGLHVHAARAFLAASCVHIVRPGHVFCEDQVFPAKGDPSLGHIGQDIRLLLCLVPSSSRSSEICRQQKHLAVANGLRPWHRRPSTPYSASVQPGFRVTPSYCPKSFATIRQSRVYVIHAFEQSTACLL